MPARVAGITTSSSTGASRTSSSNAFPYRSRLLPRAEERHGLVAETAQELGVPVHRLAEPAR